MTIPKQKFGWTGVEVPVIGQGTWMLEGSPESERRAIEALRLGIELGMTHIDTAEMYGDGRVEEMVGEAIAGRRNQIFLTSKVLPYNASFEGTLKACERSLKRLKTDYLDLYLLHWPGKYPIRDTMRAMEKLVTEGHIRFIGVSNFYLEALQEAERALRNERMACNQVKYHLEERAMERDLLPYCAQHDIALVAYSPFGHGEFPPSDSAGGRVLAKIAERHDRTPRQVALKFLTRHPHVFTIPKAGIPEHTRENSGGAGWELSDEDLAAIERVFPGPVPECGVTSSMRSVADTR